LNVLVKKIIDRFDQAGDYKHKEIFVRQFIRDLQLNFSADHSLKVLTEFLELIKDGKYLDPQKIRRFQKYYEWIKSIKNKEEKIKETIEFATIAEPHKFEEHLKELDITSSKEISDLIIKLQSESSNQWIDTELLFRKMRKRAVPNQFVLHLQVIVNVDTRLVGYWNLENILKEAVTDWSIHPEVNQWKLEIFFPFLRQHFRHLISDDYFDAKRLIKLAELFEINIAELSSFVLRLIPEYLGGLSASLLYQLLEIIVSGIGKADKQILLEWILPRWNNKIRESFGDGQWDENFLPPTSEIVISNLLRYNLGHPDKRVRWRAAHSLRRFADLNRFFVFEQLLEYQNQRSCGQFQDSTYPFYWLSAKLFLWISLERISKENGSKLIRYSNHFIEELNNRDLPHVQIKYFAKSASLALLKFDPSIFSSEEHEVIAAALECHFTPKQAKKLKQDEADVVLGYKSKFHFDTLDTVPYWYENLARAFDCSTDEVLMLTDKYISQHWGYTGDSNIKDPAKASDYTLTSNSHGSEPTVEDLRTYFEYHAMFCAAGELLETKSVVNDNDKYETWDHWIARWTLCWKDFWLSDFRDPIPLLSKFWINKRINEDWEWSIQIEDFDNLSCLFGATRKSYVPINLYTLVRYDKDEERSSISSCLVAPQLAPSLLRALQTSLDLNYYLPFEDEEEESDLADRNAKDFMLKGWIKRLNAEQEGIDSKDESFHDIDKFRLSLGSEFTKWAKVVSSSDFRFAYNKKEPRAWISRFESWNDHPEKEQYGGFSTSGYRLVLKQETLLAFLKATNQCLILNCEIKRSVERSTLKEYYPEYTYLYLIYPNGKVESISRDYQLGQKDNRGIYK